MSEHSHPAPAGINRGTGASVPSGERAGGDLLQLAMSEGLVGSAEVFSGRAHVREASRTHQVGVVHDSRAAVAVVKRAGRASALAGDDPVSTEGQVLQALAGTGLAPGPLAPQDGVWTRHIPGQLLVDAPYPAVFRRWGQVLASLHLHPRLGAPMVPLPWLLREVEIPAHMGGTRAPRPVRALREAILDSVALRSALADLATDWRSEHWIHGDATAGNAIVQPDDQVRLIDFEHAGLGDPCWDVATAADSAMRMPGGAELMSALLDGLGAEPDPRAMVARRLLRAFHVTAAAALQDQAPEPSDRIAEAEHILAAS